MRYLVAVSLPLLLISLALAENQGKVADALLQNNPSPNTWGIISLSALADVNTAFWRAYRDAQPTCFKMRTYYVEKESKHSDSTRAIGYSTCTPSAKFDLKPVPVAEKDAKR